MSIVEPGVTCGDVCAIAPYHFEVCDYGRMVVGDEDKFFSLVKGDEWGICATILIKRGGGDPARCYVIAGRTSCNMAAFDLRRPNEVFRKILNRGDGTLCWFNPSFPEEGKLEAVKAPSIKSFDATFSVCRHCLELLDECVDEPDGIHRVYLLVGAGHDSVTLGLCCFDDVRQVRSIVYCFLRGGYSVLGMHFVRFKSSLCGVQ